MAINKLNWFYDFQYPNEFIKLKKLGLVDFEYWYFFNDETLQIRLKGLSERYPNRELVPFARRDDCDDIACFENGKGNSVQIIHDYSSEGYEQVKEYNDFWAWFKDAINEMMNDDE